MNGKAAWEQNCLPAITARIESMQMQL